MKLFNRILKPVSIFLGLSSVAFFVFDFVFFNQIRPKMVAFQKISMAEEGLMNWVGVGLLLFLVFCILSLFQTAKYLKFAKKITPQALLLVSAGVLSLLFVFSDVALLSDIGKQYKYGLAQPEWTILYPILAFQMITAIVFTYLHLKGFFMKKQLMKISRDSNIFQLVQYVGLLCALMGLSLASLGFVFPRAWNLTVHTTISSIILLTPYALAVFFWFFVKRGEKPRQWYDEKQIQDVGKSAFITLISSVVFMTFLFAANYHSLGGVISILWLPLYLFFVLFVFSLCTLYFSGRE